jgi:hypothetical protein
VETSIWPYGGTIVSTWKICSEPGLEKPLAAKIAGENKNIHLEIAAWHHPFQVHSG